MKISVISFTRAGAAKNLELVGLLREHNHQAVSYSWHKYTGRKLIPFKSLKLLFQDLWDNQDLFLFLWDLEHTARAVIPCLKQKGQGPAVAVMDEAGSFVIPFAAGKSPGVDAWCGWFAGLVGASAVITAAAREDEGFDVDVFARKNQLHIQDIFRIRTIASCIAAKEPVGIYSDYPVEGVLPEGLVPVGPVMSCTGNAQGRIPEAGISITDDWEAPRFAKECRMFPRSLVLGVICREDSSAAELERFVVGVLTENHLSRERLCGIFSVRELAEAAGLKGLADRLDIPFFTYEKEQIAVSGQEQGAVCEGCAKAGSGGGKRLAEGKSKDGLWVSVYERKVKLSF